MGSVLLNKPCHTPLCAACVQWGPLMPADKEPLWEAEAEDHKFKPSLGNLVI